MKKNPLRKLIKSSPYVQLSTKVQKQQLNEIEDAKRRLDADRMLLNDTIHEIRKINNQLKASTLQLSNCLKQIYIGNDNLFREIKNIRKNIEANTQLLSIRMDAYDMLLNPELSNGDMVVPIEVYKKVEKVYKCLYAKRIEKNLDIELIGHTDNVYRLNNNIELGFFIVFENAIKYSPEGSRITAEFMDIGQNLEVVFTNTGIMPLDGEITQLIQRGVRSERVISDTNIEGSGLGLYLLDQICESNGVELKIKIGKGTQRINGLSYAPFIVTLIFKNTSPNS